MSTVTQKVQTLLYSVGMTSTIWTMRSEKASRSFLYPTFFVSGPLLPYLHSR